ncbi:MAG TPA: MATE family efflux transporter [Beijerinckiaceae bacterium]|nr:MATE family efflux transporter [Beijerinckiaceae bacterium]
MNAPDNVARVEVSHRAVMRIALPMTLAHITTPLLGFADAAVIGRLGQAHLLGAINAGAILFDFIFWGFGFFRMATAGLTAQALGAGDPQEMRAVLMRSLFLAAALGMAIIVLQRLIATIAFAALGASPEVTEAARIYYDIRIWSAPFAFATYAILGALIGRGRTDLGLSLQIAINLVNIALNVLLVYGFGLGIFGSGLGTLIAEVAGTAAGIAVMFWLDPRFYDVPRALLFAREKLRRLTAINADIMVRTVALLFSFAYFTSLGARGGDVMLAANAILMNLFMIAAFFLDGFATAAEQMCGQSLGAHDEHGFRGIVRLTSFWCLGFSLFVALAAFVGGRYFIDFISTNDAVRAYALAYLPYAALTPLLGALAFEFDGVYIGATWTREVRNLMLLALALYLAASFALRPLGNAGLWMALLLFLTARSIGQMWLYPGLVRRAFSTPSS